jgi:uncharacterized membrane protein
MSDNNEKLNQLLDKLENLSKKQSAFLREIYELRQEINSLKAAQVRQPVEEIETAPTVTSVEPEVKTVTIKTIYQAYREKTSPEQTQPPVQETDATATIQLNDLHVQNGIEKFIGENLINKIGIAITVIGVAIGAKYSIEHELISPLTRIILGYLAGLALLGFGIKLKKNYANYSAVLVSGAIAILYFITYAAYSFYGLIPQPIAFALMVVFTAFTVVAAINYNNQVIAHIGLVGAYAVPFLLSDGSGKVGVLFSYMAIINAGILLIAFKKYWKALYYASFLLTWLIFISWFAAKYQAADHYGLALVFLGIFFATFYAIFLAYKLLQKEKFETDDIILLLFNSFVFYGLGYAILSTNKTGEQLLGLFTLANAVIHFGVSAIIYKQKLADRNLFFLVAGLVLVFTTIAIPVQLDGNWVTLLWAFEAALLFWIGRTKYVSVYENLSYALMFLAFISIIQDWLILHDNAAETGSKFVPVLNVNFLTAVLFIAAFAFINYVHNNKTPASAQLRQNTFSPLISFSIPAILLTVIYFSFEIEIANWWNQAYRDSAVFIKKESPEYSSTYRNYDLKFFKKIWIINYSLLFSAILSLVNIKRIRNRHLALINIGLSGFFVLLFLTQGLFVLSELCDSYLNQPLSAYYHRSSFNIGIRYIAFAFAALTLYSMYSYKNQEWLTPLSRSVKVAFDFLLFGSLLWVASSELITWLAIKNFSQSYKLGLSILWGVYALLLIVLGIWKKRKHLRIGAIVLFSVTLLKLFFYDIAHLNTIAKTIVFVSLGVLLLLISFLYNKYKYLIAEADED